MFRGGGVWILRGHSTGGAFPNRLPNGDTYRASRPDASTASINQWFKIPYLSWPSGFVLTGIIEQTAKFMRTASQHLPSPRNNLCMFTTSRPKIQRECLLLTWYCGQLARPFGGGCLRICRIPRGRTASQSTRSLATEKHKTCRLNAIIECHCDWLCSRSTSESQSLEMEDWKIERLEDGRWKTEDEKIIRNESLLDSATTAFLT
jgi:hypothetical protein